MISILKRKKRFTSLILFAIVATVLTAYKSPLKVVPIFVLLIQLVCYCKNYHSDLKLYGFSKFLFTLYVIYCVFLLIKSIVYDDNSGVMGNYWLSLIGNMEYGILTLCLPICFLFLYEKEIISSYCRVCDGLVFLGLVLFSCHLIGLDVSKFAFVFYLLPFLSVRLLIGFFWKKSYWLYFAGSVYFCFDKDERSILIMNLLILTGLILFRILKKFSIKRIIRVYVVCIPLIGIGLACFNLTSQTSIFMHMQDAYAKKTTLVEDTRSFLFRELNEDLTKSHSWILGKGLFGTYYSQVMYEALSKGFSVDNEHRLGIESGLLWLLFKGGMVFFVLYISLFYFGICKGCAHRNPVIMFISFVLATRLLFMFVSCTPRFDAANIISWFFLGVCIIPDADKLLEGALKNVEQKN